MAQIDPPWRLDPLQTITDVHWNIPYTGADYLLFTGGLTKGGKGA
jgi:hypothetical protein